MQRVSDEDNLFKRLVEIKDEINKQIPLASNRFEEFECPAKGENQHDIDIQFHLHEAIVELMYIHYCAIEKLKSNYDEFIKQRDPLNKDLSLEADERLKLEHHLKMDLNSFYTELENLFRTQGKFDPINFEKAKNKLCEIIESLIPALIVQGESALVIDEDKIIQCYIDELKKELNRLITKILANKRLDDNDLKLADLYRRQGVPSEDEVHNFFVEITFFKHNPNRKLNVTQEQIKLFESDANCIIDNFLEKLLNRKYTYETRYKDGRRLSDNRDTFSSNSLYGQIEELLRSLPDPKTQKTQKNDEQSEKINKQLNKSLILQKGVYYQLQKLDYGLCDEHAALALAHILEEDFAGHRLEKVTIPYLDEDGHTFIVIDRAIGSELHDMSTWGDKAKLLDAWHKLACYVKDIDKFEFDYRSFPKGAIWNSLEFKEKDRNILFQLKNIFANFGITGNLNREALEARLKEEYRLLEIPTSSMFSEFLYEIVEQYNPRDFKYHVTFYLTDNCNDLVKIIPGFKEPVIAIHTELLKKLISLEISIEALEFIITTLLLTLKMLTSFVSPNSISHDSQQQIDIDAMRKVQSTDACIEYLRSAEDFNKKSNNITLTTDYYEQNYGGFKFKFITGFNYSERIKVLQSSIAAGMAIACQKDLHYASTFLIRQMQVLIDGNKQKPEYLRIESEKVADAATHKKQPEHLRIEEKKVDAATNTISVSNIHHVDDINTSATELKIKKLKQLINQLPQLIIELLPFEKYQAPSIRLREYAKKLNNLDLMNEQHPKIVELIDELINKAHEVQIPGFEYIYNAIANRWGADKGKNINLEFRSELVTRYERNTYYLTYLDNAWHLTFYDFYRTEHAINIDDVDGLREELLNKDLSNVRNYGFYAQVVYLLHSYQKMRPLGFFKDIQAAITSFTLSTNLAQAMERATTLRNLSLKYAAHMDDKGVTTRKILSDEKNQKAGIPQDQIPRFFGTNLGKNIRWQGFYLLEENNQVAPYRRFGNWCKEDKTGLLAETLFRLGLSNDQDVLLSLNDEQVEYIKASSSYDTYVFFGSLTGSHKRFYRYRAFYELKLWILEFKSNAHLFQDDLFTGKPEDFEKDFIAYYDANLPELRCPDLEFNSKRLAQQVLLKEFYRVAISGTDQEKKVVKSFFFGRNDKRDLHNLKYSRLKFNNIFSQFVCMQKLGDQTHQLFADYDLSKLLEVISFTVDEKFKPISLDEFQIIFRIEEQPTLDDKFYAVIEACRKNKELYAFLRHNIAKAYLAEKGQLTLFSPPALKILELCSDGRCFEYSKEFNYGLWPELENNTMPELDIEALINQYNIFDKNNTFPNFNTKSKFGQIIFNRIIAIEDTEKQIGFLQGWLHDKNHLLPITDVTIKRLILDRLVILYSKKIGIDNGSETFYKRAIVEINNVIEKLPSKEVKPFTSKLLSAIIAQRKVCDHIGLVIDPADYKLYQSKTYKKTRHAIVALIKISDLFAQKPNHQKAFLNYIASMFSQQNLETFKTYVETEMDEATINTIADFLGTSLYDYDGKRKDDKKNTDEKIYIIFRDLYQQFWDCSLYERAAVIEQLLISASQTISAQLQSEAYNRGMEYICNFLFPKASDHTSDDYLALCVMKSYINAANNYIRSYLLAAMLVAANDLTGQEIRISKKLSIVCEHLGMACPAYLKLLQAMHSYSNNEEDRADLAHVKGKANPPHRWSVWRHLATVLAPDDLASIKRVGRILGSASYNIALKVTLNDNSKVVLLLLRENAEKSTKEGFNHIRATIDNCEHETIKRHRKTMIQIIDEASRLSENEMNKNASEMQSEIAQNLYPKHMNFVMKAKTVNIHIKTARILRSGQGYRFLELMEGQEFNSLPDQSNEERLLKAAVAKAVVTMELHNILRGGSYNSDMHGNNLCIHYVVNDGALQLNIGLFDFGEISLEPPTQQDLRQLADVIHSMPLRFIYERNIDTLITERIEAAKNGESTHHLMRIRKALLALQDFQRYLVAEDLIEIFKTIANKSDLHPLLAKEMQRATFAIVKMYEAQQTFNGASEWIGNKFSIFKEGAGEVVNELTEKMKR